MNADVEAFSAAVKFTNARVPFVLATVVWRKAPSSGRLGSKAVITYRAPADGAAGGAPVGSRVGSHVGSWTVTGWLGGGCSEPTVLAQAAAALADGQARLIALGDEEIGRSGTNANQMGPTCESKGALEVYLEPHLPKPLVVAVGRSPAVEALATMAQAVGWEARIVDDGGDPAGHAAPELVSTDLDAALNPGGSSAWAAPDAATADPSGTGSLLAPPDAATAVVVATQGHYDAEALRAALATDAGYVGLVASHQRAASVLKELAEAGLADVDLARVHAPAGVDLGQVANAEIAVCVLADLVERRARGELMVRAAPDALDATVSDCAACGATAAS